MRTISAYLLEISGLDDRRASERSIAVSSKISEWLSSKGVADTRLSEGAFASLASNGNGRFWRKRVEGDSGSLEEVTLEENNPGFQIFTTSIFKIVLRGTVKVYATLSVTNTATVIAPVSTDARCPRVIRELIEQYPDWKLGNYPIRDPHPRPYTGKEGADALVIELESKDRTIPIVVISENEGETIWSRMAEEISYDLSGLAHVAVIDDEASWALSDRIGKQNSCYRGAVRLYWPLRVGAVSAASYPSSVWTASQLLSSDHDGKGFKKFRGLLRRSVMSTASLTVEPPSDISMLRNFPERKRLEELQKKADSTSEELEIAKSYLSDNEQLKAELDQARRQISQLTSRAEAAEYALNNSGSSEDEDPSTGSSDESQPKDGEARFYKKTHSTPSHDVLVRVTDCGHNSWQAANKADKAWKGVERLEGRSDWKNMQHCGSCTGGGLWRVRW